MPRVVAYMDDLFFQMKLAETAKHLHIEVKVAASPASPPLTARRPRGHQPSYCAGIQLTYRARSSHGGPGRLSARYAFRGVFARRSGLHQISHGTKCTIIFTPYYRRANRTHEAL